MKSASFLPYCPDLLTFYFKASKLLLNEMKFMYKVYLRRFGSTTDCCCLTSEMSNYFYKKFNVQHANVKRLYKNNYEIGIIFPELLGPSCIGLVYIFKK